jgi:excisionase family DNA binding protein
MNAKNSDSVSAIDNKEVRERPLLDVHGLAARLGVRVRYVRRLVAERRVPYIKLGHLIRFDPDAIDAWLDEGRRG